MRASIAACILAIGVAAGSARADGGAGNFALGIQIGASSGGNFSGLTGRVGRDKTIEGILGYDGDNSGWIFNGNYLVHSRNFFHQAPISALKLYGGFGVGVWAGNSSGCWVQVPLGVDFDFSIPVETSIYIAPGIDVVPKTDANWHFGIGLRYWFE